MRPPIQRKRVYGQSSGSGPDLTNFRSLKELAEALKAQFGENPHCAPNFDRERAVYSQGKIDLARAIVLRISGLHHNQLTNEDLEEQEFVPNEDG